MLPPSHGINGTIVIYLPICLQGKRPDPVINGVKWGPYKWPKNEWVTGVIILLTGVITPHL